MNITDKNRPTLLVVDDIPDNLKVLLMYLHTQRFKVLVAQDGADAIVKALYARPDLILLDVMMPEMDGYETCVKLKQDPATADIPVIFMTALSDPADKVKGFEVGGVDYITKPVHHSDVLARVTTHLKLRNLQKNLEQQNQETGMFVHTMANGLKMPLERATEMSDELLTKLSDKCDANALEKIQEIKRTTEETLSTIDAMILLMSVRIQKVPQDALNMADILEKVKIRLSYLLKREGGTLTMSDNWPVARGYAQWIEEVWLNYCSNALKYGGKPPQIELGWDEAENGLLRFWVQDNGPGIERGQEGKLFSPVTNLDTARSSGSYGLGLSIVQRMVEKCGGQVGFETERGKGSRFYFLLPECSEEGADMDQS